jgi:serine/threonine-protein kinase
MTLSPGTRLGPYEITAAIGAGGMGEVYKAKDTRLHRTVAIKVLSADTAANPERRHRFELEARAASALNHPHICVLFDVGDAVPTNPQDPTPNAPPVSYLVMEHLDGQSLAERLAKGPLPLDQALEIGAQIADALAVAHKQGIIHRDLKPGNVMLTKTGAKLLDFGLAKLRAPGVALGGTDLSSLPTQAGPATEKGTVLGTLAYMAPEQLEGKEADARSDLFAFGAVLYEMLTGTRAFAGTSPASVLSAVMSAQPAPVSSLQPLAPPALERLLVRCLAKEPDQRWDSAHDVAGALRWMRETGGGVAGAMPVRPSHWRVLPTLAVGLLLVAVGAVLMWWLRPLPPRTSLAGLSLQIGPAEEVNAGNSSSGFLPTAGGPHRALTWTPDGQALVFVGRRGGVQQLYVRRLDAAEARALANTEGAQVPAVSADGQWVAFWAGGAIRKVPLGGGPVMDLAPGFAEPPWGLAWDVRGRLFVGRGPGGSIWTVPADGAPTAVTTVGEAEVAHILPWPLPDGRTVLYTVRKRQWSWGDEEVVAQTLATGARRVLLKDAADARYVPTGHLVFLRRGVLFAVAFDADRLEIHGTPVAMLDTVAQALTASDTDSVTGAGQFAIAGDGALAWLPGAVVPYPDATLVTVDRHGQVSALPAPVRSYGSAMRVAPDGRRMAVVIRTLTDAGVWVYDVSRETATLLAGGGEASIPIWSPDGRRLVFEWLADGRRALAVQPADGTASPQVLMRGDLTASSFMPDGRQVAAVRESRDIVMVSVEPGQTRVQPLAQTPRHSERWPEFSPDGRWLAYGSDVSGRFEVYVRAFPGPGPAEPVSVEGGWSPAWHPSGRELFFVSLPDPEGRRRLMAVDFFAGPPPRIGRPHALFAFDPRELRFACVPVRCYDIAADGQRFYVTQSRTLPRAKPVTHLNLNLNWFEELKVKVPPGR